MASNQIRLLLGKTESKKVNKLYCTLAAVETVQYQLMRGDRASHALVAAYLIDIQTETLTDWVENAASVPVIALCNTVAEGRTALKQGARDYWCWAEISPSLCERSLRLILNPEPLQPPSPLPNSCSNCIASDTERLLQAIANTSPQLLYLYDVNQNRYSYINDRIETMLGYQVVEVLEQGDSFFHNCLSPDRNSSQQDRRNYFAKIDRNEVVELEYRIQHKDGSWRWWRSQEVVFNRNADGTIAQILGTAQDITPHKSIEMQLWRSESRLHAIVANLNDGILIVNRQGVVCFANPAALRLFNQSAASLVGREFGLPFLTRNTTEINIAREDGSIGTGEISVAIAQWDGDLVYVVCARDITARRQAEETLRESEERFRQLADHLQAVFWLSDFENNRILYISPAYEKIWGRSRHDVKIPDQWLDSVLPEDREIIIQGRDRHLQGQSVELEYRIMRPDGEIRWIGDRAFPILDRRGRIIRAAGIAEDMTERKRAEIALRDSEERWRALFEQAAVGIFVVSLEGRFEQVNQKFCDLVGYTAAELQALDYAAINSTSHESEAKKRWQSLISGQILTYSIEKEYKTKKNRGIWVNIALSLVYNANKEPLYVLGAVTDLSDRQRAELALRQQIHRERLLTQIAQNIHSSVDLDEILDRAVTDARKLLNADRALIFRLTPSQEGMVSHESVREGLSSTLGLRFEDEEFPPDCYENYRQGKPRIITDIRFDETANCLLEYLQEFQVKSRLSVPIVVGNTLWGLLIVHQCSHLRHWQPWEINLLSQVGIQVAIATQQTELYDRLKNELQERRRATVQLEQAKEMADAANRAKSEFLANMSHELRTPLNAILGFTQLLDRAAKQLPADASPILPQQQEYIEIIKRSGEHLLALINDILDLSKIEAGRMSLNPEKFDLWQLLDRIEEMFSFKAASKDLALQVQRSPNLPQLIETDAKKLHSILINLLGNAVKFTERGQVILRVTAQNDKTPSQTLQLQFEVEDTGIGIKSPELSLIFQAFTQSHPAMPLSSSLRDRSTEGTGLGLAISEHFVRLMGGEITVRSEWGKGSVFRFNIPCNQVENLTTPAAPVKQYAIAIAGAPQEYRIALVEDDVSNRRLLTSLLEPLGFATRSAGNGLEAVELWQQWQPHLILMDIRMPVLDGYEAMRRIRQLEQQHPQRPSVAIIGLTASVFQNQQNQLKNLGCDDWIVKPFSEVELLAKVANCLHIDYQYAVQSPETSKPTSSPLTTDRVQAGLNQMSAQWRSQLQWAALSARRKNIHQLIAQIPPEQAEVAATLSGWVERLDFDRIIELLE
ncbi:MAG: PAS domain S-box protein [Spirulinaceae cyanobacterium]